MELKAYLHRLENIKAIHDLDAAGLNHHVIAVFLSAEGISMTAQEVTTIVNTYDALGKVKLPNKSAGTDQCQKLGQNDETLPCPV